MFQRDRLLGWDADGTGSGSCPVAGFGISCVDSSLAYVHYPHRRIKTAVVLDVAICWGVVTYMM